MKQLLSSWTFLLNSLSMDFKTKTEHHGLLGEFVALIVLKCLHLLYVNGFDISHFLHFHCKWGPESNFLPHSLDTLCPASCLISLQLFPWWSENSWNDPAKQTYFPILDAFLRIWVPVWKLAWCQRSSIHVPQNLTANAIPSGGFPRLVLLFLKSNRVKTQGFS